MKRHGRQTTYRKTRFRSMMEARWAVFLDFMHQPWLYEPQRFEFSDESTYLPDFWLPAQRAWAEVKPEFEEGEGRPQRQLAIEYGQPVYVFVGSPAWPYDKPSGQILKFGTDGGAYFGYHWTSCYRCSHVSIDPVYQRSCSQCGQAYGQDSGHNTARIVTATVAATFAIS